jgi:hypothetical protein
MGSQGVAAGGASRFFRLAAPEYPCYPISMRIGIRMGVFAGIRMEDGEH